MVPTVLIAEDEADLREYLADLFRARGCNVLTAADGPTALGLVTEAEIHFAVIDMLLPGGSGFQVLSDYKNRAEGQGRAVMISGNGSDDHQHYAKVLGADLFLVKPFPVETLLAAAVPHLSFPVAAEAPVS